MNTRLGHYDIVEELGRGGMGVVYKGYESSLGRYVAIKVLSAAMAHDKVFVERFLREARSMATLNDSHIIQIYFIGQDEDQTFFVMEYIDGESLAASIKREVRLELGDALKVLMHTSQGLATAHSHGVIHRDIKPGNIMITTRGQVKVADFGIALANRDASAKLTNAGEFVGTPGYLSPEVCLGKAVDQRSDIWALGIVLFEMLTGRMPFNDESPLRLMLDVVQADAPDIRELNPDVDEEVSRILTKMLAKDPADRYQSCDELNEDLKKHPLIVQGGQLRLRPAPPSGANSSNSSNPTVVGMPTPMTPGNMPRAATPPPVVSSARTPVITHAPVSPAAAPAAAASKPTGRILAIAGAVLVVAGLGWAFGTGKFKGAAPEAPATATTAPADGPAATPPATPATPTPPAAPPAAGTDVPDDLIPVPETAVAGESVTAPSPTRRRGGCDHLAGHGALRPWRREHQDQPDPRSRRKGPDRGRPRPRRSQAAQPGRCRGRSGDASGRGCRAADTHRGAAAGEEEAAFLRLRGVQEMRSRKGWNRRPACRQHCAAG